MMNWAFIFPGQASQEVGMAQDLYDVFPQVRTCFDQAEEILGFRLSEICFEGPEDQLKQTIVTQPAVFVHSIAVCEVLAVAGLRPQITAGHSLGEYSAMVAAGALSFEEALVLVKRRGELMQKVGDQMSGVMVALIGLDNPQVQAVCDRASCRGVVVPANFNAPGQVVISGMPEAVQYAGQLAREAGAKRVIELPVSGAFHSPLMEPAAEEMCRLLAEVEIAVPEVPVICNVTGALVQEPEELRRCLMEQITRPVRWADSVDRIRSFGAERFVEVGPGNVLKGMVRRFDRHLQVASAGTVEEVRDLTAGR